jgi:hypothetical protein
MRTSFQLIAIDFSGEATDFGSALNAAFETARSTPAGESVDQRFSIGKTRVRVRIERGQRE